LSFCFISHFYAGCLLAVAYIFLVFGEDESKRYGRGRGFDVDSGGECREVGRFPCFFVLGSTAAALLLLLLFASMPPPSRLIYYHSYPKTTCLVASLHGPIKFMDWI